jgi:hypothetical protein
MTRMPSSLKIVERCVDLLMPSGKRVPFRVEFGPVRTEGRDFRCRVRFHGWGDSPPEIWGYDSLQALLLAVGLVRAILADFTRRGGRVLWPGTSADYDMNAFVARRPKAKPSAVPNRRPARRRVIRQSRKGAGR